MFGLKQLFRPKPMKYKLNQIVRTSRKIIVPALTVPEGVRVKIVDKDLLMRTYDIDYRGTTIYDCTEYDLEPIRVKRRKNDIRRKVSNDI